MKRAVFSLIIVSLLMLVLPVQASFTPSSGKVHIVQPGQTLFSIARWYGIDWRTLAQANSLVNPNHIYAGQRLTIPSTASSWPTTGTYIVKPGDTLYGIARHYGVTAWAIAQANGLYSINHIYVGQRLMIPGSAAPAPQPQPKPQPQPSSSSNSSWRGEYYAGTDLSGGPRFVRDDHAINFHWGLESPDTRLNTDQFSVRWTREINFRGGLYRFIITVDDGARLWIDGDLVLDAWRTQPETTFEVDVTLAPGEHTVSLDYFENIDNATIQFNFKRLGDVPCDPTPTPTPSSYVGPTPTPVSGAPAGGWLGEYYANIDLHGDAIVTRVDPNLGFEWQRDAPMPEVPDDFFSVRWTQTLPFYEDNYAFCAMADDGVRLYLDDVMLIDEWHGSSGYPHYCTEFDVALGDHVVTVEYYEDGGEALIYVWWERH